MKNITAKQAMTYVFAMGFIALLAVYFLVYKSYNEKAEALEKSNATKAERVAELKVFYDNLSIYNEEIALYQAQIAAWLDDFPADVKEEDTIVLALDTENVAEVNYSNINIGSREALWTIPASTMQLAKMENLMYDVVYVERNVSYVNTTDYFNLKRVVETINNSTNRLTISNIAYSRNDESGELMGTIEVSFYSVVGTDKEYVPQTLREYESGLENLFGTTTVSVEEEPESEEGVEE
ncbi:MAG: hypothetical protein HDQ99_08940 [Lachnospiraceae bacterium]|nr:hypothetical protein [Lachnospiraceae bacterium]